MRRECYTSRNVCYTRNMEHAPGKVLTLRVPPDTRARLEALRARRGPEAPARHALAVEALRRGLEALEAEGGPPDAA